MDLYPYFIYSTAHPLFSCAPRDLLVHGFVMDEEGHKMSKSKGNVVDPHTVIHGTKVGTQFPVTSLLLASPEGHSDLRIIESYNLAAEGCAFVKLHVI